MESVSYGCYFNDQNFCSLLRTGTQQNSLYVVHSLASFISIFGYVRKTVLFQHSSILIGPFNSICITTQLQIQVWQEFSCPLKSLLQLQAGLPGV